MTRKQYIRKLRGYLRFRLPAAEIKEILADLGECFDQGLSEGDSEEMICTRLGPPAEAAAELLEKYRGARTEDTEPVIKTALVLLAGLVFTALYISSCLVSVRMLTALPLIPAALWVMSERSNCIRSFTGYSADGFMTTAAVFLALSGLTSAALFGEACRASDGYDIVYMLLTAAFIAVSAILWTASVIKRRRNIFLPLAFICLTVSAAAVSGGFFGADYIGYGFVSAEEYRRIYLGHVGEYCLNFYMLIVISAAAMLIYINIRRDAFSLPSSEILLGVLASVSCLMNYLDRIDPTVPYDVSGFDIDGSGIIIGIAAGTVTLAAIVILRIRDKKEAD